MTTATRVARDPLKHSGTFPARLATSPRGPLAGVRSEIPLGSGRGPGALDVAEMQRFIARRLRAGAGDCGPVEPYTGGFLRGSTGYSYWDSVLPDEPRGIGRAC